MQHLQRVTRIFSIVIIAGFFGVGLIGCEDDGPVEEAGEQVAEAFEEASNAVEDTADEAEDAAEETEDEIEEAADEVEDEL